MPCLGDILIVLLVDAGQDVFGLLAGGERMNKKQLCTRCKRELDWEFLETIKSMDREDLIKIIIGFKEMRE